MKKAHQYLFAISLYIVIHIFLVVLIQIGGGDLDNLGWIGWSVIGLPITIVAFTIAEKMFDK